MDLWHLYLQKHPLKIYNDDIDFLGYYEEIELEELQALHIADYFKISPVEVYEWGTEKMMKTIAYIMYEEKKRKEANKEGGD